MKSDRWKVVFVHIPKCGGSSIEDALWLPEERTPDNFWMGTIAPFHNRYQTGGLQHLTALQLRHAIGRQKFAEYYKFSIVRHPTEMAFSQFNYMRRRPDLMNLIGMFPSDSFVTYLRKTYRYAHVQWQPQVSFLFDYAGNCLVDFIARLEHIDDDFEEIRRACGLPPNIRLPHSRRGTYAQDGLTRELTVEARALLMELYKDDFEKFDYPLDVGMSATDR